MDERVRLGIAGPAGRGAGRSPERVEPGAVGEVSGVAETLARRSFLYDDPGAFRAGIAETLRALRGAGLLHPSTPTAS